MIELILFIFGSCIGSFLNVCIYRLPNSKSIVTPPSACPGCNTPIRFYDNIPILSFLLLGGRCRSCRAAISIRYPLVELMAGLFAVCAYLKFGLTLEALITYLFIASLIVITFIDIDHRIIPDAISLPGIPIGFAASFFSPAITYLESLIRHTGGWRQSFVGGMGLQPDHTQRGHGGWGHQTSGHDRRLCGVARCAADGIPFVGYRHPLRSAGHDPVREKHETGNSLWTLSGHWEL